MLGVLAIVVITTFFVSIIKFIFPKQNAFFDFEGDLDEATPRQGRGKKITGDKTLLGTTGGQKVFADNKGRHFFACGTSGSGKTVAIANFIKSGIDYDYPMLILDGKGDEDIGSIRDIVKRFSGDREVYIINLNNPEASDKYNPFKNTSPTVIKDMLVNMTVWTEEHYKQNTERYLQKVISLMVIAEINTSFRTILAHLDKEKFMALSADLADKEQISKDEHQSNIDIAENSEKIIEGAVARFTNLYESDIGAIFADDGIDISTALSEKSIILFILNPLLYPETSPLFGNLILIDSKKAISFLFKNRHPRVFFIFDEINVYASPTFLDLINKSRSANVTCILATQSLSDLDHVSPEFKEQIIENANNYIVLRQNSAVNAENWANIIGTRNTMDITYQLREGDSTGLGSAKRTREYLYHPDYIKSLETGKAIFVSKDNHFNTRVNIENILDEKQK